MSERQYILAIDQGTTGSTVLVIDVTEPERVEIVGRKTVDFQQHYPQAGWVEHDLGEIWVSVCDAANGAILAAQQRDGQFQTNQIVALGITNQRETICPFYRSSGAPASKAIVWQCRRSAKICEELKAAGHEAAIKQRTGLVLDPYFSGTKIAWYMRENPQLKSLVERGEVLFGTIDTYLLYRLTNCQVFATEPSNASRTLMYDIGSGAFEDDLRELCGLKSRDVLPEVLPSAGVFGKTKGLDFLPDGIPIAGILGDQQAALAGQTCFDKGEGKCTYGTGAFLLLNTGSEKLTSTNGLLTTVAWGLGDQLTYAFEGSSFIAGAAVQFIRDQMGFLAKAHHSEAFAEGFAAAPEVYFVPALAGLGAPTWDPYARGAFLGLTRGTSKNQMVRAALEGIAFQVNDLIDSMRADFPSETKVLRVDGGASGNSLLMQTQANFSQLQVDRPQNLETTALGAAMFAGLGVGIYPDLAALRGVRQRDTLFSPDPDFESDRDNWLEGWQRAVAAVQTFSGSSS